MCDSTHMKIKQVTQTGGCLENLEYWFPGEGLFVELRSPSVVTATLWTL